MDQVQEGLNKRSDTLWHIEIVHVLSAILGKKEKRGLSVEENVHNLSHGS